MKLYQVLARTAQAYANAKRSGNTEWADKHEERVDRLVKNHMPSGGGFDNGTKFDLEKSIKKKQLIFHTSFHHMSEHGYYSGWTEHTVTVVPDLHSGFDLKISGRDRNDIKNYIGEVFHDALTTDVSEH